MGVQEEHEDIRDLDTRRPLDRGAIDVVCRERVHVSARPGEGLRRTWAEPRADHTMNRAALDRWSAMGASSGGG
jgi:hypothetical protein